MPVEKYRRNLRAVEQVAKVAVGLVQLIDFLGQTNIDGMQLLVERLQLLFGRLEFLIGGLHLFVDGMQFLVRAAQFLEGGLVLFNERLQLLRGTKKCALKLRDNFRADGNGTQ
jgi:hypothetical protein